MTALPTSRDAPPADPGLRDLAEVARRLCGTAGAYVAVPGERGPQLLAWAGDEPDGVRVRLVEAPFADRSGAHVPLPGTGGVLAVWGTPVAPLAAHLDALAVLAEAVAARLPGPAAVEASSSAAGGRATFLVLAAEALEALRRSGTGSTSLLVLEVDPAGGGAHLSGLGFDGEVARRLRGQLRPGDALARLSGRRWAVLLPDLPAGARYVALGVADRLHRSLHVPLDRAAGPSFAAASTGLAFCSAEAADDPLTAAGLLGQAEHAANVAVRRGAGRFHVHKDAGTEDPTDDLQVEHLLREALDDGALVVHYQPVVALPGRQLVGVEALVRLRAPDGSLVPPDRFIPIAERCGLIGALGDQVRRVSMATVAAWKRQLPAGQSFGLGVNLSVHELDQVGLVDSLRSALLDSGLDPAALNLEITESAFLEEGRGHELVLAQLRALGTKLFIDDFGTGCSSLSYLRRFPVDGLKIDRTFVGDLLSGPQPQAVTGAILHLAQELGVHVVAEGVESEQQATLLGRHGCRLAQGYLFSRPVSADEARQLLLPAPRAALEA